MTSTVQQAADAARRTAQNLAESASKQAQQVNVSDTAQAVSARVSKAIGGATNHPQVQQAVNESQRYAQVAARHAQSGYNQVMQGNGKYVLSSHPTFGVTKHNVWRYAVFTTLAECAPR